MKKAKFMMALTSLVSLILGRRRLLQHPLTAHPHYPPRESGSR